MPRHIQNERRDMTVGSGGILFFFNYENTVQYYTNELET